MGAPGLGKVIWLADLTADDVATVGGKAANLGELIRAGLPVPDGFVISTDAYRARAESAEAIFAEVDAAYRDLGADVAVAVRSSATVEDSAEASFAGQLDTFLNVVGGAELRTAIRSCWASIETERAGAYRAEHATTERVAVAVVVQRMIPADAAGVMFTANPATGRRDQLMISAAWGLGEAVVSGQVDTDVIVVDAATGAIASRQIADKQVQTTYAGHGTADRPVAAQLRTAAALSDQQASTLAQLGLRIEAHFGPPQDVEWALADGEFWILQARPITSLPEPEDPPPTDWSVPDRTAMYVRASIVEQLPDPLTPLFAELIDPAVTHSLAALFNELSRRQVVRAADVALPTVNGYAYYRYTRAGMTRMIFQSGPAFAALLRRGRRGVIARWRDRARPHYAAVVQAQAEPPLAARSDRQLLDGVRALLEAGAAYYTAVQTIIPIAAGAEVAFTRYYDLVVRRRPDDPPASGLLLGFDSIPIQAEQSLYDLAQLAAESPVVADRFRKRTPRLPIDLAGQAPELAVFRSRFAAHLDRFGHLIYNLDFANPVPADDPQPLLDAIAFYLTNDLGNPAERQQRSARLRDEAATRIAGRLGRVRWAAFRRLLGWAQRVAPIREDALADVGLAWPLLRRLARELGDRLVAKDAIAQPADIFWLRTDEIESPTAELRATIDRRKRVWRGQRRVLPPQLLPEGGWGEIWRRWLPASSADPDGSVIHGLGASPGSVTALARVVRDPADFAALQPGEVLVAAITTPAWTPLFARAAAVVTDIGGPLSHSSIVAREYGIPAVLGTGLATRRIADGQLIRVDGDAGTVTLLE